MSTRGSTNVRYACSHKHSWLVYCHIDTCIRPYITYKIRATRTRCRTVRVGHCTSAWDTIRLTVRTLHTHTHAILPGGAMSATIRNWYTQRTQLCNLSFPCFLKYHTHTNNRIIIVKGFCYRKSLQNCTKVKIKMSLYSS